MICAQYIIIGILVIHAVLPVSVFVRAVPEVRQHIFSVHRAAAADPQRVAHRALRHHRAFHHHPHSHGDEGDCRGH